MDFGRTLFTATQLYVSVLLLVSAVAIAWVFGIFNRGSLQFAGIWFGVIGFGLLILVTVVIVQLTRD